MTKYLEYDQINFPLSLNFNKASRISFNVAQPPGHGNSSSSNKIPLTFSLFDANLRADKILYKFKFSSKFTFWNLKNCYLIHYLNYHI